MPLATIQAEANRRNRRKIDRYYPDEGPLRRELYPQHLKCFEAGLTHRERLMLAANRVGKTEGVGAYESTLHLTGQYPSWWTGRRFTRPTRGWAAGDTSKTVREIIQEKLLGQPGAEGTGMIPGDLIVRTTKKAGVSDAVDTIWVRHASGGNSTLVLKSYLEGREAFQGTSQDFVWLDEEPPQAIYTECLVRTMTTGGICLLTFTPLNGLSEVVLSFLPGGDFEAIHAPDGKFVVFCTWDQVPHLTESVKAELWRAIPPHQRDARSKGIPSLGSGAIYPVPETDIVVDDFAIPPFWPRAYGLDVGWNKTAAVWAARNPDTGEIYLYSEHYAGKEEPAIHVAGIQSRGKWIPGVIDPAARGRAQHDGEQLMQNYIDLGLDIEAADNAVTAGIYKVWELFSNGKLKVFKSLGNWRQEFRLYRRDEDGKIVKKLDHLMDATRYVIKSGLDRMKPEPVKHTGERPYPAGAGAATSWMG